MKRYNSFLIFLMMIPLIMGIISFKRSSYNHSVLSVYQQTIGSVTDIDGNVYKTIKIGNQWWMAENLRTTKLNDGTPISLITSDSIWMSFFSPAYCWYANDVNNKNIYGALYNWFAVQSGKLCPKGWHVPSDAEWTNLAKYLGFFVGSKLKESGTKHWNVSSSFVTNESNFSALPGGSRFGFGKFGGIGEDGFWWTSTMNKPDGAWCRYLFDHSDEIGKNFSYKTNGFSIRCVKD